MKIAVFADVHGNLEALQAFIDKTRGQGVDSYMFLGDIVGYGPNPNECVEAISRLQGVEMVLGNHDSTAILKTSPYVMNNYAREAIFWTLTQMKPEFLSFLQSLKLRIIKDDICYAHSSPESPEAWVYLNSSSEAFRAFSKTRYHVSFVGHTHWPRMITRRKMEKIVLQKVWTEKVYVLDDDTRYIINCGSIGQPRDGNSSGSYLIFDDQENRVVFHRVDYAVAKTITKIREAKLPEFLAVRLKSGR